jgi:hypothetical protein
MTLCASTRAVGVGKERLAEVRTVSSFAPFHIKSPGESALIESQPVQARATHQ